MKITILCDNSSSDIGCLAEWGFSLFIENNGVNILFDSGYSDVYKHNAKNLGISLNSVDFVVLSHFHNDHSRGLQFHEFDVKKKLIMHPDVLEKLPNNESQKLKNEFEVITSKKPIEFSKDMIYLGEIPRINKFESGEYNGDKMLDDSAIILKTPNGVVVIAGCSHAGICNICEYAKKVSNQKLYAVIGGFHLFEDTGETKNSKETLDNTIKYFHDEKISYLLPMHCIDFSSFSKLHKEFQCKKYNAGDIIEINT